MTDVSVTRRQEEVAPVTYLKFNTLTKTKKDTRLSWKLNVLLGGSYLKSNRPEHIDQKKKILIQGPLTSFQLPVLRWRPLTSFTRQLQVTCRGVTDSAVAASCRGSPCSFLYTASTRRLFSYVLYFLKVLLSEKVNYHTELAGYEMHIL